MKKLIIISAIIIVFLLGIYIGFSIKSDPQKSTYIPTTIPEKPLKEYSIENLSEKNAPAGVFRITEKIKDEDNFSSHFFKFTFKPKFSSLKTKTTTGLINIPTKAEKMPIVIMLRGYVDQELYKTGDGTKNSAEYFADNGFITVAPDFLGYASSDEEAGNIFEARFQTYTSILSLLSSIDQIDRWDGNNIFFWGHSNGGQIALTVLEITGKNIPTTLWAPVSTPFPYSILYYTNEAEDRGKLIRGELYKFEDLYDTDKYSLVEYLNKINAPIQIHQGTADDAVPVEWSDTIVNLLKNSDKEVEYFIYPGADHNMRPSWNTAIERGLDFFQKLLHD